MLIYELHCSDWSFEPSAKTSNITFFKVSLLLSSMHFKIQWLLIVSMAPKSHCCGIILPWLYFRLVITVSSIWIEMPSPRIFSNISSIFFSKANLNRHYHNDTALLSMPKSELARITSFSHEKIYIKWKIRLILYFDLAKHEFIRTEICFWNELHFHIYPSVFWLYFCNDIFELHDSQIRLSIKSPRACRNCIVSNSCNSHESSHFEIQHNLVKRLRIKIMIYCRALLRLSTHRIAKYLGILKSSGLSEKLDRRLCG